MEKWKKIAKSIGKFQKVFHNFLATKKSVKIAIVKIIKVDLAYFTKFKPKMHINAIHPSSPNSNQSSEDDQAAIKIQASFRGYRVRKNLKGSRKMSGKNSGNQESAGSSSESKSETNLEAKSATKIQAGIRGFLVRKHQKKASEAATKIQANFRGFKTRKELKSKPKDAPKSASK